MNMLDPTEKVTLTNHALQVMSIGARALAIDDLKLKVRALTAHVNRSRLEFERVIITLDTDETKTLARTLYKELMEVISAVEEAK